MEKAVVSKNLAVKKGKKIILDSLNFQIEKGSLNGLIGPSGSGKTTLIRTIVGLQRKTAGELDVLGLHAGSKALRRRIGYVTQTPSVYGDLTVKQNLRYFAVLLRVKKARVEEVISEVQLGAQSNQLVSTLSGGQRARVSLAVALLGEPELLVLDEPTVGLDPLLRQDLWQLFQKLANSGRTLLISSHVMDEAERCNNLILLRDGRLLWHDSKDMLLNNQKVDSVEQAFLKLASGSEAK